MLFKEGSWVLAAQSPLPRLQRLRKAGVRPRPGERESAELFPVTVPPPPPVLLP